LPPPGFTPQPQQNIQTAKKGGEQREASIASIVSIVRIDDYLSFRDKTLIT
jgi:hypothetical protein